MSALLDQYKEMHSRPKIFAGLSLLPHIKPIKKLIKRYGAKTLLDYGCGKGEQYLIHRAHKRWFYNWGGMPTLYDPAYEPFSKRPEGVFDGVICTDVLEHVPEEQLDEVIRDIVHFAKKFIYVCVATAAAKKTLPDGRNCHLTVRPEAWWKEKMSAHETEGGVPIFLSFNNS